MGVRIALWGHKGVGGLPCGVIMGVRIALWVHKGGEDCPMGS